MLNKDKFREFAHLVTDWIADYFENIESYPVKSKSQPKDIINQLPDKAPETSELFNKIFEDFENIIMPGITHWEHPNFHAYFPANNSYPSILGEMLTAAIGAQCMIWQTSPAAAELEERVMEWLRDMTGLPSYLKGVIQDTASTATLVSILTAREKFSDYKINEDGFNPEYKFRVYCSAEAHSSIEKAVKIAGIGKNNLVKIPVNGKFEMIPAELEKAIIKDIENGYKPLCVVAALGTTGSTAVDPISPIGEICSCYGIWYHIDAAFAGTAMLLPEFRHYLEGIEYADTYVFNPHKWMFTNFDCSAYFVKDEKALIGTFEIMPEYLKTPEDERVNNYRDWGIQLGRRFRALKLWFVIRNFGVEGLKEKIRQHLELTKWLQGEMLGSENFEILAPVNFNTICFRFNPGIKDEEKLNEINSMLENNINGSGKIFLTHTKLNSSYALRFVTGQTNVEKKHIENAWQEIRRQSEMLLKVLKEI